MSFKSRSLRDTANWTQISIKKEPFEKYSFGTASIGFSNLITERTFLCRILIELEDYVKCTVGNSKQRLNIGRYIIRSQNTYLCQRRIRQTLTLAKLFQRHACAEIVHVCNFLPTCILLLLISLTRHIYTNPRILDAFLKCSTK